MADVVKYRFVLRRGLAASWTAKNEILLQGEFGLETDTRKKKIGDGITPWNDLPYDSGESTPIPINPQTGTTYTLILNDAGAEVQCSNASPVVVTIPKDVFQVGDWLLVSQTGTGIVSFIGASGVSFETSGDKSTLAFGDLIGLEMVSSNTWRFIGGPAGLPDAPTDSTTYGRKNSVWVPIPDATVGRLVGLNDQSGTTYSIDAADAGKDVRCTNSAAITVTIQTQADSPVVDNFWSLVSQGGAGTVSIVAASGVTLRAPNGASTSAIYDARGIERIALDEWRVW